MVLDVDGHELRRGGAAIDVQPQVFSVLVHLIEHRERVVSKEELLDSVWHHRFVTESALTSRIKSARQLVGDNGRDQRMIRTVHGRGYRFVAPLLEGGQHRTALPASPTTSSADAELTVDRLGELIDEMTSGRGRALALVGPPGSGKTAILERLRDRSAGAGLTTGYGSSRLAALRTYGCVIDAIDELLHRDPGLVDAMPPGCRRELEHVLGGQPPTGRQRWHLAVRELLVRAAARSGGVLLALDDVHHADPETLALASHIGRIAEHHPVTVVVATRPDGEPLPGFTELELPSGGSDEGGDSGMLVRDLPDDAAEALRTLALVDGPFDVATVEAALDTDPDTAVRVLDLALASGVVDHGTEGGFRFRRADDIDHLTASLSAHRQLLLHARLAERFGRRGADPRRVAHHHLLAGDPAGAVPHVIEVARTAAAAELHREVLDWTGRVLDHATGHERGHLLALRAGALTAVGDPSASSVYREALRVAPADAGPGLRVGLARAALLSGDLETAQQALAGLEPSGGEIDGEICLARGMLAYFLGDLDAAEAAVGSARDLALSPGAPARLLDVITLEGLIAHNRGVWSDRLFRELRNTVTSPTEATTVFDSHLCVAEYMLYGPTPYDQVVEIAENLLRRADDVGAQRAAAFAVCVAGEAELLAGHLDRAEELLERSVDLHRGLLADTGLAHSMQRLAELRVVTGDRSAAEQLGREALTLARWSPLSRHLLQRTYGTLIAAAADLEAALEVVDEAAQVLDDPHACEFCQVMISVPSAIACAEGGRLDEARRHLAAAELSASLWEGTAWQGAVAEARACLMTADGDQAGANALLAHAATLFERAGQPIDAERCRDAIAEPATSTS